MRFPSFVATTPLPTANAAGTSAWTAASFVTFDRSPPRSRAYSVPPRASSSTWSERNRRSVTFPAGSVSVAICFPVSVSHSATAGACTLAVATVFPSGDTAAFSPQRLRPSVGASGVMTVRMARFSTSHTRTTPSPWAVTSTRPTRDQSALSESRGASDGWRMSHFSSVGGASNGFGWNRCGSTGWPLMSSGPVRFQRTVSPGFGDGNAVPFTVGMPNR